MGAFMIPKEIPVKPPNVEPVLLDFGFFGYCFKVHLETLRTIMIERGPMFGLW